LSPPSSLARAISSWKLNCPRRNPSAHLVENRVLQPSFIAENSWSRYDFSPHRAATPPSSMMLFVWIATPLRGLAMTTASFFNSLPVGLNSRIGVGQMSSGTMS
jgi:hypothetical protein